MVSRQSWRIKRTKKMNRPKLNQVRKRYICECRLSRREKLYYKMYIAVMLPRLRSPILDVLKIELKNRT